MQAMIIKKTNQQLAYWEAKASSFCICLVHWVHELMFWLVQGVNKSLGSWGFWKICRCSKTVRNLVICTHVAWSSWVLGMNSVLLLSFPDLLLARQICSLNPRHFLTPGTTDLATGVILYMRNPWPSFSPIFLYFPFPTSSHSSFSFLPFYVYYSG